MALFRLAIALDDIFDAIIFEFCATAAHPSDTDMSKIFCNDMQYSANLEE